MKTAAALHSTVLLLALVSPALHCKEPFYPGLGSYTRKVTTPSEEAQRYFDQGLALFHGFNHGAALRSFRQAAALDPECAMAHWGVALANGPHINVPMVPPPAAAEAWAALSLAQKHAAKATRVERELIRALAMRYADPPPDDRSALDRAYADAMRKVWRSYPRDPDVGTLFAESLMLLRPWDQWTPDGKPQPGTEEIVAALDAVLRLNPNHPFANHLTIHAIEASQNPERALAAADRLRELQPGLAHNVHMPSHIDVRLGRWQEAITANVKAIEAARRVRAMVGPPPIGPIYLYQAHNYHMLSYAAMMTGQSELAIYHIRRMAAQLPPELIAAFGPVADGFVAMPYEVLLRFGRWDDVLAAPDHPETLPFSRSIRRMARGVAFAAQGNTSAARAEQREYLAAADSISAQATLGFIPLRSILAVATPMLEGEILFREGSVDDALAKLRAAVAAEDALRYAEPPAWFLPARHALGAALMQAGRYVEAEQVYREDLKRLPENGWSLFGLAESLRLRGRADEAAAADARFQAAWRAADVQIKSSCMCQPGVERAATLTQ